MVFIYSQLKRDVLLINANILIILGSPLFNSFIGSDCERRLCHCLFPHSDEFQQLSIVTMVEGGVQHITLQV